MDQAVEHEGGLDLTSPSIYADWHEDRIRFRDLDPLGHVTSLAFLTYFETARVLFLARCGAPVEAPEMGWMLVRVEAASCTFPARCASAPGRSGSARRR